MQIQVVEIQLKKHYKFMYENFVFSTPYELYVFLNEANGIISALKFKANIYKYGSPNDEALNGHPLWQYGLGFYGFYEVINSPWITELKNANKVHPRHNDDAYKNLKHFIVTFKDVTLEVISITDYEEVELTKEALFDLTAKQIIILGNQG